MLVQKEYKRNKKTGDIVKREKVEVICDRCGLAWDTLYQYRKKKVLDGDFCSKCRAKKSLRKQVSLSDRRWGKIKSISIPVQCKNCGKSFERIPTLVQKNVFCNIKCRDQYWFKTKYGEYDKYFSNNPDEVAYLFGFALGDGHFKKVGKLTTRVSLACDATGKWDSINRMIKEILDKLKVSWRQEPIVHHSCAMIGFMLPDDLLAKYGMLFSGNKYDAQPRPIDTIVRNANFAVGLLNSDGSFYSNNKNRAYHYTFSAIVESISNCFGACLKFNNIKFGKYNYAGKFDKRTGATNKDFCVIHIAGAKNICNLHKSSKFPMKASLQ